MKKAGIIIGIIVIAGLAIYFCSGAMRSSTEITTEDQIVVTCAEAMLWDYSYTYTPEWGYISPDDSHQAFLIELARDDIFLYEEHHPFIDNEKAWLKSQGYSSYIAFKADYYRDMFNWGDLPPTEIMDTVGITERPQG